MRTRGPRAARATPQAPALDVALRFLVPRPRTEQEVRWRLRRAGIADETIDNVIAQLQQRALLDDAAFARYWLEQRQTFRPRGARLIRAELRRLGVEAGVAQDATATTEPAAEDDAYRAAYKRATQLRAADEQTFRSRLGNFLVRRGFDWATVSTVVDRLWSEAQTQ